MKPEWGSDSINSNLSHLLVNLLKSQVGLLKDRLSLWYDADGGELQGFIKCYPVLYDGPAIRNLSSYAARLPPPSTIHARPYPFGKLDPVCIPQKIRGSNFAALHKVGFSELMWEGPESRAVQTDI